MQYSITTTLNVCIEEFIRDGDELVKAAIATIKDDILTKAITAFLGVDEFTLFEAIGRVTKHALPCGEALYTLDGERLLKFMSHSIKTRRYDDKVAIDIEVFYHIEDIKF